MEEEEKDDDDDNGRDSGLSSHPSVVVVVVGGSQVSGSTLSASDSPFDPYNANVLLAADVIYNVGKIPSLIRATHKFILLPDRPLPPPSRRLCPNGRHYFFRCRFPLAVAAEGRGLEGGV